MDPAWIKVVVLTLAECVAPEGKTVCQEQQVQYSFVDEVECQQVLEQLIDYRDSFENVIVNRANSSCQASSKNLETFESRSDADPGFVDTEGYVVVGEEPRKKDFMQEQHELRLQSLPVCDASQSVTPCKQGQIIVESVSQNKTEIWQQDR